MSSHTPDIYFPNLGISLERVPRFLIGNDPDLSLIHLSFMPLNIYLYAAFIVVGITLAALIGFYYVHVSGQNVSDYVDLLIVGVVLAFIGLRSYYLFFNWDQFRGQPILRTFFQFRDGGLAIYGGIIGAAAAALIMSRYKKIPFRVMADAGAPSMLLGQAIGRWGNFFNREAFGGYTDGLFAMRIRVDQAHITNPELFDTALVFMNDTPYFQVHPTFFYESALNFVYMIALILYRPHKRFNGEIVLLYFLGYGVFRFFIEGLRMDQMIFFGTGLPLNQITSLLFVAVSILLLVIGHLKASKQAPTPVSRRKK